MNTKNTAQRVVAVHEPAPARHSLIERMAARFSVDPTKMLSTLKQTAFRTEKPATDEQMMALLLVADQYGLNPWTREIYAFEDKYKGIVPVVGVDGWLRIINEHAQFDGVEFVEADDGSWVECTIYRRDRSHPTRIREYLAECCRDTAAWRSHPRRMLRHKTLIQGGRIAFGFAGIYDQDEAERIIEGVAMTPEPAGQKPATRAPVAKAAPIDAPANDEQLAEIRRGLDKTGLPENELLAHLELGDLTQLRFERVPAALEWIASRAP